MTIRESLHELVDELPEDVLGEAESYLRELGQPSQINWDEIEWDDEPVTEEDAKLWDERLEAARRGHVIPHEEVLRMFQRP